MTEKSKSTLSPEQQAAWEIGVESARKALSLSSKPILMMDELSELSMEPDFQAAGWNSIWASAENKSRFE